MKKISILMAIYHPNLLWLKEQIVSLEKQTYPNLELWIIDDGPDSPVGKDFFSRLLKRIPYHYRIHEKNRGSDQTFSELVDWADGDYFAFCDQDDVWLPTKVEELIKYLKNTSAQLTYCLLSVIDENGKKISNDIRTIRKADFFPEGEHIAVRIFRKSCIYGCSMILRAEAAKQAIPVPESFGYDHWFCLWMSLKGKVSFLEKSLVEHRLHEENQSTPFREIKTKADYFQNRILGMQARVKNTIARIPKNQNPDILQLYAYLLNIDLWVRARRDWYEGRSGSLQCLWKLRWMSPQITCFEIIAMRVPDKVFHLMLKIIAKYFI